MLYCDSYQIRCMTWIEICNKKGDNFRVKSSVLLARWTNQGKRINKRTKGKGKKSPQNANTWHKNNSMVIMVNPTVFITAGFLISNNILYTLGYYHFWDRGRNSTDGSRRSNMSEVLTNKVILKSRLLHDMNNNKLTASLITSFLWDAPAATNMSGHQGGGGPSIV